MLRAFRVCLSAFLLVVVIALWGCGGPQETLVPVTGKVMVEGKALTKGNVSFRPDKAGGNTSKSEPHADIEPDGTYTLMTGKRKGAPVGKYVVLVAAAEEIDPKNPSAAPKLLIDAKWADPTNPLLRVEVVEDPKSGKYDLDLKK